MFGMLLKSAAFVGPWVGRVIGVGETVTLAESGLGAAAAGATGAEAAGMGVGLTTKGLEAAQAAKNPTVLGRVGTGVSTAFTSMNAALMLGKAGIGLIVRNPLKTAAVMGLGHEITGGASTELLVKPAGKAALWAGEKTLEGVAGVASSVAGANSSAAQDEPGSPKTEGLLGAASGVIGDFGSDMKKNGLYAAVPAMAAMAFANGEGGVISKTFNAAAAGVLVMLLVKFAESMGVKLPGIDLNNLSNGFNQAAHGAADDPASPQFSSTKPTAQGPRLAGPSA